MTAHDHTLDPRSFNEFLAERVGPRWVVCARMTPNIRWRYGDDIKVITPKQYKRLEREHAAETADRIGLNPLRAIRAMLTTRQFHSPDTAGYWLAFERIAARAS